MKLRDVPAIPTIIVGAAIGIMIALGAWQLGRAEWKTALIERYSQADKTTEVLFPKNGNIENALYRRSSVNCDEVLNMRMTSARSRTNELGYAHVAECAQDIGGPVEINLGWTKLPDTLSWGGGTVDGIVAPVGDDGARLIASKPPLPELEPLPKPDPKDMRNNHLAYAGQWFFFALTALVIYILAIRSRKADEARNAKS